MSFRRREAAMLGAYLKENTHAPHHRPGPALADLFTIGRPIAGIICLLLQITLIGWLPAAIIWAVYALSQA